ncbi:cold shock domain-containing protein [Deinococcus ruber]|uniref:Cold-shock protein n=1 Tax=Deinococcus ruber TaxID=1848197 RepID=A0A918F9K9_9DEIO|nr:hypothetical protein GCM10008957_37780 [Deinococcus ruber]
MIPSVGQPFPDLTLPDQRGEGVRLSDLTRPSVFDRYAGLEDGSPVIVIFGRGFFCPRDQQQLRGLVGFQPELRVNFARLVYVSADPPRVGAAFRAGLGADWPFLSDEALSATRQLGLLDETEGEYAYRARPYTFVLRPDLHVHSAYDGWYFVGRPTVEELRRDLREIMRSFRAYPYEVWDTPEVRAVRIPQQVWAAGAPPLGASGLEVAHGAVKWFDLGSGNGMIVRDETGEDVFFNFTAIPGEGYRTVRAGTRVAFEIVPGRAGPSARNVQTTS